MTVSPGRWHELVPRGSAENLRKRDELLAAADKDRTMQTALMGMCAEDFFFWVDLFAWQVNPRMAGNEVGPFILRDFQRAALIETIHWLYDEQEDVVWEKSRYQGATWLALLLTIWLSLFKPWKKFLWISHTEDAVGREGDPDSLFWKIDFVHSHLPDWMTRGVKKRKMGFGYPATNSSITGAATTERAGVGGRATSVGLDEFAKQKDDYKILGNTAHTGPRLFISTHYGSGTAFAELCRRPDINKVVLHWSQNDELNKGLYKFNAETNQIEILDRSYAFPHDYPFVRTGLPSGGPFPGIRSPWYDREVRRAGNARDIAMHLDIDVKGSVSQFFDALIIHQLRGRTKDPVWQGELNHDRDSGLPVRLVPQENGSLRLWMNPKTDDRMPAAEYGIGVDISAGMGSTPSCISIIRIMTGEKVGEYVNAHIKPIPFATLCVALCRLFADEGGNGAFFVWEQQGPGEPFGQAVVDLGYRHLWFNVDGYTREMSSKPGWYPAPKAKRILLEDYKAALVDGSFHNPSDRALEQCLEFRYNASGNPEHPGETQSADPSAGRVNHGDLVIADGLAWLLAKDRSGVRRVRSEPELSPKPNTLEWLEAMSAFSGRRNRDEVYT